MSQWARENPEGDYDAWTDRVFDRADEARQREDEDAVYQAEQDAKEERL